MIGISPSSNIARRHMTAGQRAMAYARIYPAADATKFGEFPGVTSQRVSDARLIIEWAPHLVDAGQTRATGASRCHGVTVECLGYDERSSFSPRSTWGQH
jgi:hypothetical protein